MTAELEKVERPVAIIRPQVGLMLSIGEPPVGARNYPKKLDHFRPKPGTENQYADAVAKFEQAFPGEPKRLDIVFVSNNIDDALDIRLKAWGTSGLRAIGQTNYALCPERMLAFDDTLVTFPDNKPGSYLYELQGPDDPVIEKTGLKLYAVLRFALPAVTGLTTLAEISTTSKRSMLNLLAGIQQLQALSGGQLAALPLVLGVRAARTRYFDEAKKKRSTSTFYELIIETPLSIDEFFTQVQLRRAQMAGGPQLALPPVKHDDAERDREIAPALWNNDAERQVLSVADGLGVPNGEEPQTRDEPETVEMITGAQLNRISALLEEYDGDTRALLYGAFGVDEAEKLTEGQAVMYEQSLRRLVEDQAASEVLHGEVDDGGIEF
jgi:hypothetical protein